MTPAVQGSGVSDDADPRHEPVSSSLLSAHSAVLLNTIWRPHQRWARTRASIHGGASGGACPHQWTRGAVVDLPNGGAGRRLQWSSSWQRLRPAGRTGPDRDGARENPVHVIARVAGPSWPSESARLRQSPNPILLPTGSQGHDIPRTFPPPPERDARQQPRADRPRQIGAIDSAPRLAHSWNRVSL
jgi:hypothetical protein